MYILNRLKEPSTWTGLGMVCTFIGSQLGAGVGIYPAIAGAILGIILPERKKKVAE